MSRFLNKNPPLTTPPVTPTSFPDDKLLVIASPLGEASIFPREYNLLVDTVIIFFRKFSLNLANFNWANQRNSRWHCRLNRDVLWDVTQSRWTLERDPGEPGCHTRQVETYNAFQIKNITCIINQTSVIAKASWLHTRRTDCGRGWFALLQLSHGWPP